MDSIRKAFPSFLTCLVVIAGCISVTYSLRGRISYAGYFIIAAALLDFSDGFFARILNAVSAFGKQLDSLADVVSFGVAPSMIIYRLIYRSLVKLEPTSQFDITAPGFTYYVLLHISFLLAVFAAIRLAKFNIDDKQKKSFIGLPVPASALFISSIAIVSEDYLNLPLQQLTYNIWFLIGVVFLLSILMVSAIPMFSFKFESYRLKNNIIRYVFIIVSAVLLLIFKLPAIALLVILYIVISILSNLIIRKSS